MTLKNNLTGFNYRHRVSAISYRIGCIVIVSYLYCLRIRNAATIIVERGCLWVWWQIGGHGNSVRVSKSVTLGNIFTRFSRLILFATGKQQGQSNNSKNLHPFQFKTPESYTNPAK